MKNILFKKGTTKFQNAAIVPELKALEAIHQKEKNIAIYERDVKEMEIEINQLMASNLQLKMSGSKEDILNQLSIQLIANEIEVPMLFQDVKKLLETFEDICSAKSFRLNLLTVNSNMCRRFHTDINDLRLLCTYSGQGTFWLPEEAANRNLHHAGGKNEEIVVKPKLIQQANTGDVLILKGALYPEAEAAIHRSPSIEESEEIRLLLRIDTNEFANFG